MSMEKLNCTPAKPACAIRALIGTVNELVEYALENVPAEESARIAVEAATIAQQAKEQLDGAVKHAALYPVVMGETINIKDAAEKPIDTLRLVGKTVQTGSPSPITPAELVSAITGGNVTVVINGAEAFTVSPSKGLHGIPVASGGNYTDENGQEWVCDEVDFNKGVYIQRIARIHLDGSTPPDAYSDLYGTKRFDWYGVGALEMPPLRYYDESLQMCNRFMCSDAPLQLNDVDCAIATYNTGGVFIRYDAITSTDAMVNFLAANPVDFMYVLMTPIETALPDGVKEAFAQVVLEKGTNYFNADGAFIRLSYRADNELYFNPPVNNGMVMAPRPVQRPILNMGVPVEEEESV